MRVYCVIFLILSMFEKFQDKSLQGNNYQFKVKKKTQYVLWKKKDMVNFKEFVSQSFAFYSDLIPQKHASDFIRLKSLP